MEKKIGNNVSSGAEKVERVEEIRKSELMNEASGTPKETGKKKGTTTKKHPSATGKKEKEKAAAKTRTQAAKKKAAAKEARAKKKAAFRQEKLEKKAALKAKKLEREAAIKKAQAERKSQKLEKRAAIREKRLERHAEKTARRELLKNESEAERQKRISRERKERAALRRQKSEARDKARENKLKAREASRERAQANRQHKREQRTERKKSSRGIGGWLAAVISLGVACLALATVVTAGGVKMNDMTLSSENGYRSTLFEMVSVSDDLSGSLSKLRVSSGADEQRRLLTNVLVDSALMESALERVPVDEVTGTDISAFVNKTGSYARTLLSSLASGKPLSEKEKATIAYLAGVNDKLYGELNTLVTTMSEKQLKAFLKGGEGTMSESFTRLGEMTKTEPEEIIDAPFAGEGNVGKNRLAEMEEVTRARAEELVKEYFADYRIKEVAFTGETNLPDMSCYDFSLTDEKGAEFFAEITKNGGKLAFFTSYEECSEQNFDIATCDSLARDFLAGLGIEDVEAVWLSDAGLVADITYVPVDGGVRRYPAMIRVRVCEEKGKVIGMEAKGYLYNRDGFVGEAKLTEKQARGKLSEELQAERGVLSLVPVEGKEVLVYEFYCTAADGEYVVYLDANTGEEVELFRVRRSAQGSYLR